MPVPRRKGRKAGINPIKTKQPTRLVKQGGKSRAVTVRRGNILDQGRNPNKLVRKGAPVRRAVKKQPVIRKGSKVGMIKRKKKRKLPSLRNKTSSQYRKLKSKALRGDYN